MSLPAEIFVESDLYSPSELAIALGGIDGLSTKSAATPAFRDPILVALIAGSAKVLVALIAGLAAYMRSRAAAKPASIRIWLEDGRSIEVPSNTNPERLESLVGSLADKKPTRIQVSEA